MYEINQQSTLRPERYFELVHNFPTDFNFYLSRIREGIEGSPTVVEKYTSEPHNGSYIHILYLALGWIGGFVRVPWHLSSDVYHVARTIFGFTLLVMFAKFAKQSFATIRWQVFAFLVAVTASSWPKFQWMEDGSPRLGGYMPWWSVMDSLQRITFIPHLVLGQALMIFLVLGFCNDTVRTKWGNWIFLGVMGFVLGVFFPPGIIVVWCVYGFYALISAIFQRQGKRINIFSKFIEFVVPMGVNVMLSVPSLVYLSLMTGFYPWKRLAELDIIKPLPFQYQEYFTAVGPVLPLGILGLLLVIWKRETRLYVAVAWVMAWAFLLGIFNFIPQQSPLRFSEMIPHLPLGLLSVYVIYTVYAYLVHVLRVQGVSGVGVSRAHARKITNFLSALPMTLFVPMKEVSTNVRPVFLALWALSILCVIYIALFLFYMYSSYMWQHDFVDHKIRATYPLVPQGSYVMYPLKDFVNAIRFIQDTTKREEVVLSEVNTGNYIPVYSGNTVYIGHDNTVKLEEKKMFTRAFYAGTMKPAEAQEFLQTERISRIFYGPLEKEDGGHADMSKVYPFLEKVYENSYIMIYKPKFN